MEMMIAVMIVAVMTAIAMPHLLGAGQRAQALACQENERTIRDALAEYYMLHHQFPAGDTAAQLQALVADHLLDAVPKEPAGGQYTVDETDPDQIVVTCSIHGNLGGAP
ncbi:hypothetical protein GCM10010885_02240 [Alicyclobacillus cellulosilyticus]|uniref:Uncharacterized protein n=2 Tax=Alicyclobacillus cellulosilyticus TaxID=1003997 RepID=A0A917K1G6_9BACL|nr:hypothetical protein GCM10010885_02240 [Alicyclobacillus cellulosilyticus]